MTAVISLFNPRKYAVRRKSSGTMVIVYALTGFIWLGLAIGNYHDALHSNRAWMQALAGVLYLASMVIYLRRWLIDRRAA